MEMYFPGVHNSPWAAYGIQFRLSAFLMEAVTKCYYTEWKKHWTELV